MTVLKMILNVRFDYEYRSQTLIYLAGVERIRLRQCAF